ncbi:MAG: recombinase family protein [Anaerolineales bacterium]|nr:recombinase family protein [Anaerolineales bacterium]
MRYAAYVRISSEEQIGNFSVEAQKRAIAEWVKSHEGKLVRFYIDEGQSGRTSDRPEFIQMRRDAKSRSFDAIVVHKFDRFARNRTDALAIKSLLRQDYGVKVFSVSEPSEDSDGPMGALIEGIMESVADWYSRNLASETRKGKREKARQGYHNNRPPFGYDITDDGVLIPNEKEIEGLRRAFEMYTTGRHSDTSIAKWLNENGYISKSGKPFNTDTVRDMLQNQTYLGKIKYQPYARSSNGSRSYKQPIEWFEGKHEPIIDAELFERCQEIRRAKASHHEYYPKHRVYLLSGMLFCAECIEHMPSDIQDEDYGKMRAQANTRGKHQYYRCRARDFGRTCGQGSVKIDDIEEQLIAFLHDLKPPTDWRKLMVKTLGTLLGDKNLEQRIGEIKSVIERMDFRWDNGFITDRDHYLEQRVKLQQELEQLSPIPDDDLETAADILTNFSTYWANTKDNRQAQRALIQMIVARVWVRGTQIVAISLRPNYHVTLGLENEKSTEKTVEIPDDDLFVHRRERRVSGNTVYHVALFPPLNMRWHANQNVLVFAN